MISESALKQSIRETDQAVSARRAELNAAKSRLVDAQRELRLLVELAEIRGFDADQLMDLTPDSENQKNLGGSSNKSEGRASRVKTDLLEAVIEILAERGSPIQIRELMAMVQARGVTIPGSGQQANLIAHISRDERIVRPRRGFYALRANGADGESADTGEGASPRKGRPGARRKGGIQS